jgi:DNA-binding MarR family transcriptional regulator
MPGIRVTERQAKVLRVIEEEHAASLQSIASKTSLRMKIVNKIIQSLVYKGLVIQTRNSGVFLYSETGMEYILPDDFEDEAKILQFLRESKGATRNQISVKLGFNWKRTIKLLSNLEKKGLVEKIEYNWIKIYFLKTATKQKAVEN